MGTIKRNGQLASLPAIEKIGPAHDTDAADRGVTADSRTIHHGEIQRTKKRSTEATSNAASTQTVARKKTAPTCTKTAHQKRRRKTQTTTEETKAEAQGTKKAKTARSTNLKRKRKRS